MKLAQLLIACLIVTSGLFVLPALGVTTIINSVPLIYFKDQNDAIKELKKPIEWNNKCPLVYGPHQLTNNDKLNFKKQKEIALDCVKSYLDSNQKNKYTLNELVNVLYNIKNATTYKVYDQNLFAEEFKQGYAIIADYKWSSLKKEKKELILKQLLSNNPFGFNRESIIALSNSKSANNSSEENKSIWSKITNKFVRNDKKTIPNNEEIIEYCEKDEYTDDFTITSSEDAKQDSDKEEDKSEMFFENLSKETENIELTTRSQTYESNKKTDESSNTKKEEENNFELEINYEETENYNDNKEDLNDFFEQETLPVQDGEIQEIGFVVEKNTNGNNQEQNSVIALINNNPYAQQIIQKLQPLLDNQNIGPLMRIALPTLLTWGLSYFSSPQNWFSALNYFGTKNVIALVALATTLWEVKKKMDIRLNTRTIKN